MNPSFHKDDSDDSDDEYIEPTNYIYDSDEGDSESELLKEQEVDNNNNLNKRFVENRNQLLSEEVIQLVLKLDEGNYDLAKKNLLEQKIHELKENGGITELNRKPLSEAPPLIFFLISSVIKENPFAIDILNILLDAGIDVNVPGPGGRYLIHMLYLYASFKGMRKFHISFMVPINIRLFKEVLTLLIQYGLDVSKPFPVSNKLHAEEKLSIINRFFPNKSQSDIEKADYIDVLEILIKKDSLDQINGFIYKFISIFPSSFFEISVENFFPLPSSTISRLCGILVECIKKGGDVNIVTKDDINCLHIVLALINFIPEVKETILPLLLQNGIKVNIGKHDTPLSVACKCMLPLDVFKLLLDNGADVNFTPTERPSQNVLTDLFYSFTQEKWVDYQEIKKISSPSAEDEVMTMSYFANVTDILIRKRGITQGQASTERMTKANINNIYHRTGNPPIMLALKLGNYMINTHDHVEEIPGFQKLIQTLVVAGAEVDIENNDRETPLSYATTNFYKKDENGEIMTYQRPGSTDEPIKLNYITGILTPSLDIYGRLGQGGFKKKTRRYKSRSTNKKTKRRK